MGFGLYKPGQGYWVRVMTAAMVAVITFATAGWLMGQMAVLADKLPVNTWSANVGNTTGQIQVGQRVKLLTSVKGTVAPELLGTAQVKQFDSASQVVTIGGFTPAKADLVPTDAGSFAPTDEGSGFTAPVKGSVSKVPPIQPVYLQGGGAAVVLLAGAALAFYFAGVRTGAVEFLISTDMEMKKVNWSTRKDITNSTLVVVGASVLLAATLFGIDVLFQQFFKIIKVLQ
jgi:preprotein translocase SecE subunit